MFLTADELQDLTGRKRIAEQTAWLRMHSIPFLPDANGRPKVLRTTITGLLGAPSQPNYGPQLRLG